MGETRRLVEAIRLTHPRCFSRPMKPTLSSLLVLILAAAAPCPAAAADEPAKKPAAKEAPAKKVLSKPEAAAVAKFRKEMGAVKIWLTKLRADSRGNEGLAHQIPVKLAAKLAAVPAAGLPKDLAAAFQKLNATLSKRTALLKGMPKEDAAVMEWMAEKFADEKFSAAASALQDEQADAEQALVKCAAQYGAEAEADIFDSLGGDEQ